MEKQKHTPEQWKVAPITDRGIFHDSYAIYTGTWQDSQYTGGVRIIARTPTGIGGEYLANARLIASAPELLASLKEMRDATASVLQAIHKLGLTNEFLDLVDHKLNGFGARADAVIAKAEATE